MEDRRRFILKGATLVAAGAAATVVDAPDVIAQPKFQWRMPTYWSPAIDVLLGNAQKFAKMADEMSGGRFKIQVFAAGELMPAFGCLRRLLAGHRRDVQRGGLLLAGQGSRPPSGSPTVPVRPEPAGHLRLVLLRRRDQALGGDLPALRARPPSRRPPPAPQMMGWFKRKINSTADLKGLKMRIPGLGGQVYAKYGDLGGAAAPGRDLHRARARASSTRPSGSARTTT